MNKSLFNSIALALLAIGCSTDSEPEPDIPPISVNAAVPTSMPKENLQSIYLRFSHPDRISGEVSFSVDRQTQFTRNLTDVAAWDTTFTPQLLGSSSDLDADDSANL